MEKLNEFLKLGLREFVDAIPAAIFVKDSDSRIILMNRACEEDWGIELAQIYGTNGASVFPADQLASFLAEDRRVFASGEQSNRVEPYFNTRQQQDRIGHTFKRTLPGPDGRPKYLVAATIDITDQALAQDERNAIDEKLRGLFDLAPMGIALTDMAGSFLEFNRAFEQITGYSAEELRRLDYWTLTPPEYAPAEAQQLELLQTTGRYGPYEKDYVRKDGTRLAIQLNGTLIHDPQKTQFIWSIVQDISERRAAERAVQEALLEREALLKEVHHRVKNNLQVITSLLRLEGSRSGSADTREVLMQMQNRIRTMAIVHDLLHKSSSYANINMADYLRQVATQSFRMQVSGPVSLTLELAPIEVDMQRATSCGLIVNELISNCLKHAFPGGRVGEVRLELALLDGGKQARLRVSDNGVGLPADFEFGRAATLGLQLVSDLARQIGAELAVEREPVTTFSLVYDA